MTLKEEVRQFWDKIPCGTREIQLEEGTKEFYAALEKDRNEKEPFISEYARFKEQRGKSVLEIGFGAGSDFINFARHGADLTGIDLTDKGASLVKKRLALEDLKANIHVGDAENLPFDDEKFDMAYSWGVIHHTENTPRAAQEIMRVLKPGGRVCVMLYHRYSLVSLQCWIAFALLRGKPWRTFSEVIFDHVESIGTKAYTIPEALELFSGLSSVKISTRITPYDLRISRNKFLPNWMQIFFPDKFGWFLIIEGIK